MSTGAALLLLLVVIVFYFVSMYNRLVSRRNEFKNAFSQIDVQLQRRYELIPNLVETAKGYLKHEKETLCAVISARNDAKSKARRAADKPDDANRIKSLAEAESVLDSAMGQFQMLVESYPDLKADQTMADLSDQLITSDNRVAFARQAYSDSVMIYNTRREQFPSNIIANMFTFKEAGMFEMRDKAGRDPVKVSFA